MGRLLSSLNELGFFDFAAPMNLGASRCKGAAGRRIDGRRRIAFEQNACGWFIRIERRQRRQQHPGVWVLGLAEDIVCRPGFDQMPQVHRPDAIAHVTHHTQVVGDEKIGQVKFTLQFLTLQFP
jgi:hypothetical protein